MDKTDFIRIFICCVLYILVTVVVCLMNNSFKFYNSLPPLRDQYYNNMTFEYYNISPPSSKNVTSNKYYIKTKFVETSKNIFVLGAAARNTTNRTSWSEYVVYGQLYKHIVSSEQLSCCLRYTNGSLVNVKIIRDYKDWMSNQRLGFLYVTCPNPMGSYENSKTMPEAIALINRDASACQSKSLKFIKLSYPLHQSKGSFAITSKIAHGNLDPNFVINWMETYRILGATKICTCAYSNLNKDARKVLEYYSSTGFLDLYTFELADIENKPRDISIQDNQIMTDLTVISQHMFELHRGYEYYSVIDWDEFIIPNGNISLLDLASSILEHNKWKSIMFKSQFYIKKDDRRIKENTNSLLTLNAYRWKLPKAEIDRPKSIYRPDDIEMAFSHRVFPKEYKKYGKRIYTCPESTAVIYHCRRCIPRSDDPNICVTNPHTVKDDKLAIWAEKNLNYKVIDVKSKLKLID